MSRKIEKWQFNKPKCNGCKYQGTDLPCEYILITGNSPKSQGAHIDPEGDGGCELYAKGKKIYLGSKDIFVQPSAQSKPKEKANPKPKYDYDKAAVLYKQGRTDKEIAAEVGCKKETIMMWRKRHNLKPNLKVGMKSKIDHELAMEHYKMGENDHEIAKVVGMKSYAIVYWRKLHNLPANHPRGRLKKLPEKILVVRCKDCKHWWSSVELCKHENCCEGGVACVKATADHYCGYGEKR